MTSLVPRNVWLYLIGIPVGVFAAGFIVGSLPFSFSVRLLLSIVLVLGILLYINSRVSRTVNEVRDDPISFFMRQRQGAENV